MAKILILYSTVDGQTRRICEALTEIIGGAGHDVALSALTGDESLNLKKYDLVVIGASVRYGHHRKAVRQFIDANAGVLAKKRGALFSVNLVARNPDKRQPDTNPYLVKLLRQIAWVPNYLCVFAGRLDYSKCGFWDRLIIKLIMKITHGPTDVTAIEFTDWDSVCDFGELLVIAADEITPGLAEI